MVNLKIRDDDMMLSTSRISTTHLFHSSSFPPRVILMSVILYVVWPTALYCSETWLHCIALLHDRIIFLLKKINEI